VRSIALIQAFGLRGVRLPLAASHNDLTQDFRRVMRDSVARLTNITFGFDFQKRLVVNDRPVETVHRGSQ
jgi:hypothetical protein